VPEPDRWDEPDEEDVDEESFGRSSAIGARVDPEITDDEDEPTPAPEPSTTPEPTGPRGPRDVEEASAWRRLGAYVIDSLLLTIPTNLLVELVMGRPIPTEIDLAAPAEALEVLWPFAALAWGLEIAYFTAFEGSKLQATIGKHLLELQVTDERGRPPSLVRAGGRNLAKLASALPFFLGFLMIFTSRRNQALHDHLASCLVLEREDPDASLGPTLEGPGGGWEP
jgi:uncharacterized RDD family membrane protein YckC